MRDYFEELKRAIRHYARFDICTKCNHNCFGKSCIYITNGDEDLCDKVLSTIMDNCLWGGNL